MRSIHGSLSLADLKELTLFELVGDGVAGYFISQGNKLGRSRLSQPCRLSQLSSRHQEIDPRDGISKCPKGSACSQACRG